MALLDKSTGGGGRWLRDKQQQMQRRNTGALPLSTPLRVRMTSFFSIVFLNSPLERTAAHGRRSWSDDLRWMLSGFHRHIQFMSVPDDAFVCNLCVFLEKFEG